MRYGTCPQILLWESRGEASSPAPSLALAQKALMPSAWVSSSKCPLTGRPCGDSREDEILASQKEGPEMQSGHLRNPAQDDTVAFNSGSLAKRSPVNSLNLGSMKGNWWWQEPMLQKDRGFRKTAPSSQHLGSAACECIQA